MSIWPIQVEVTLHLGQTDSGSWDVESAYWLHVLELPLTEATCVYVEVIRFRQHPPVAATAAVVLSSQSIVGNLVYPLEVDTRRWSLISLRPSIVHWGWRRSIWHTTNRHCRITWSSCLIDCRRCQSLMCWTANRHDLTANHLGNTQVFCTVIGLGKICIISSIHW